MLFRSIAEAFRIQYLAHKRAHESAGLESAQMHLVCEMCGIMNVASELADSLARDNSRFDKDHFLAVVRGEKELNSRPGRN